MMLKVLNLLGAVLVVLKALSLIQLSWGWVLLPFGISIGMFLVAMVLGIIAVALD